MPSEFRVMSAIRMMLAIVLFLIILSIHDIKIKKRKEYGEYHHLFHELCLDGERFQLHFRLSRSQLESCFHLE